jgi:NAD(P)-dependent dehydrogenase (short-subunit alcohol dehydrogenase family)
VDTAVREFGGVDVLFANAAYEGKMLTIPRMDLAEFDAIFATNVRGTFLTMQRVLQIMLERGGGSIVVTLSTGTLATFPGLGAYAASKAALHALVRTAATEVAGSGIRVNAVIPGVIDNEMLRRFYATLESSQDDPLRKRVKPHIPAGRFATNEEIAKLALFFASDDASYCHGAALVADGGMTLV